MNVSKEPLDKWDAEIFEEMKVSQSFRGGSLRAIMTDLCNRDLIPAGKYVIRVSW
jgi:hypothetical protein